MNTAMHRDKKDSQNLQLRSGISAFSCSAKGTSALPTVVAPSSVGFLKVLGENDSLGMLVVRMGK